MGDAGEIAVGDVHTKGGGKVGQVRPARLGKVDVAVAVAVEVEGQPARGRSCASAGRGEDESREARNTSAGSFRLLWEGRPDRGLVDGGVIS